MILGTRVKFLAVIILFVILSAAEAGAGDPNLVAWWNCDNAADNNIVTDSSGNGYDGNSVRDTCDMHVDGKIGGALTFDGTDYITITGTPIWTSLQGGEVTINLWFKSVTIGRIFGFGDFYWDDDEDIAGTIGFNDDAETVEFTSDWANNDHLYTDWVMLTITLKQTDASHFTLNVYFDGELDKFSGQQNGVLANIDSATEYIGGGNPPAYYNGSLDDVRVYDKALSQGEIDSLYEEGFLKQKQLQYFRRRTE